MKKLTAFLFISALVVAGWTAEAAVPNFGAVDMIQRQQQQMMDNQRREQMIQRQVERSPFADGAPCPPERADTTAEPGPCTEINVISG